MTNLAYYFMQHNYLFICIPAGLLIAIVVFFGWRKSKKQWQRDIARIARIVGIIAACFVGTSIVLLMVYLLAINIDMINMRK